MKKMPLQREVILSRIIEIERDILLHIYFPVFQE